jgi:hypothetical protein
MIPVVHIMKISSQMAVFVINRRCSCQNLIETRSVRGLNRSFGHFPDFFSECNRGKSRPFSTRDLQRDQRPNPIARVGAQIVFEENCAGKLRLQVMGFPQRSTRGLTPKERCSPSAQHSGWTGPGSGWPSRRQKARYRMHLARGDNKP